jgi:16S rRNA (cytidine1402-2'-O)-methyltransferase
VSIDKTGVLYIVATPIGHLGDISARALEVLAGVDLIAAEDTRHSARLLRHYGIGAPTLPLHEHNEREQVARLVERLGAGASIALLSDAGTPVISDPGHLLVRAAQDAGIRTVPLPGPSALAAALAVSGQPADRFVFEGFLPSRAAARAQRLAELRHEARTLVFYEAPHRILDTLRAMRDAFGEGREVTSVREISKIHETVRRAPLGALCDWVGSDADQQRGEIVLVVRGADAPPAHETEPAARQTLDILLAELPLKQAAVLASRLTGVNRNRLYELGLELKGK